MLPGHRRIRRADEFRAVMRGPARASTTTVVVHLGPIADASSPTDPAPSRAGFVVGRSVGGAVVRNRVKRRLRHIVAPLLADLPGGWGLVVRALPAAADAPLARLDEDVRSALLRCLKRVGQDRGTPVGVSQ